MQESVVATTPGERRKLRTIHWKFAESG
jgi:hypothetical protein